MFVSKIYYRTSLLGNGELEIIFLLSQTDYALVFNHGDFFLINKGNNFSLTGFAEMTGVEGIEIESIMCTEQYDPIYIFFKKDKIIKIGFYPNIYGELIQGFQVNDSYSIKDNSVQTDQLKKMQIMDLRYNGGNDSY